MTDDIVNPIPPKKRANTRKRLVAGTADLIRRKGLNATSLRDVVSHVEASRGAIPHHFPGGKHQLLVEAVQFAGEQVSVPLGQVLESQGSVRGLASFMTQWGKMLEDSQFDAGCPILVAAVEPYDGEDQPIPGLGSLREKTNQVFNDWHHLLKHALQREGVAPRRAESLCTLVVAAVEGSIALCRAQRSVQPLHEIQRELIPLLEQAIAQSQT